MEKRLLVLLLIIPLILVACGGPAEEAPAAEEPAEEAAEEPAEEAAEEPAEEEMAEEEMAEEEAEPAELRPVNIAVGTFVLNVTYPWLNFPQSAALGYWEDLGYDVTVDPVGASLDALQQLVGGNSQFNQVNSTVVIQANVNEGIPMRVVHATGINGWGLAVPADSDITSVEDFKGRSVGVFSLASGGIPLMRAYLTENDIDPDSDIEMIPVGFGPQASEALNSGDVDAVMLWGAALASLENLGHDFRYFRADNWRRMPDFVLATTQDIIDEDRQMVVDIVKGANMALAFARANPECTVQLHWETWPDTKPGDVDDETALAWELNSLAAQMSELEDAFALNDGDLWGFATADDYQLLQDFMLEQELIEDSLDPSTYLIDDPTFWEEVNDFDPAPIIAQAEACDI